VLNQTFAPLEVIVVDDGSTDETESVAREFGVRYIRLEKNSGAQAARNRGVAEARGEWIAFQDSDDEWLPDKLERQVALIEDEWTVVHGSALVPGRSDPLPERRIPEDALTSLLQGPAPLLPALLVSRAALERIGGLDEHVPSYQEWDTSIRLAHDCRFREPAEPVFVYHLGGNDSISASGVNDLRGYLYVIEKHRDEIDAETWEEHLRFLARRALNFGLWDEARGLLERCEQRDARWRAYALCARLRVRPSRLARLRRA
jgi:glycosyltransferase involved in cell wall biosynthesis